MSTFTTRVCATLVPFTVALLAGCSSTAVPAAPVPAGRASGSTVARTAVSGTSHAPVTPPAATPPAATRPAVTPPANGTALSLLAMLAVKGRAPMTGYSRAQFGPAWSDATSASMGHNGCGTRDDILASQLNDVVKSGRCIVVSGSEVDPYTGTALHYVRGHSTVDIDHVAALGDDWQTGAQMLSLAVRTRLANDPLNLLAVQTSANRQKGDGDAATWLPKVKSYRCAYVARQVAVKYSYGLWVTPAERDAITRVLATCPMQQAPTTGAGHGAVAAGNVVSAPAPSAAVSPAGVYYANCTAARAAGVTPLHSGDPGYRSGLDRDGDGIACE